MHFILIVLVMVTHVHGTIFYNTCTRNAPILTVFGISVSSCKDICSGLSACTHVAYSVRTKSCSLYSAVTTVYQCSQTILFRVTTSLTVSDPNYTDLQYCSGIVGDANMIILGNVNLGGARRRLECVPQYAVDGAAYPVCQNDGSWTSYGGCVRVCSAPLLNATLASEIAIQTDGSFVYFDDLTADTIHNLTYYVGSYIKIECFDIAQVIVGGPADITCQSDGSWTAPGYCASVCSPPSIDASLVVVQIAIATGGSFDYYTNPSAATASLDYIIGSYAELQCSGNDQAIVGGRSNITWKSDKSWSLPGYCVQTCKYPDLSINNLVYAELKHTDGWTVNYPSDSEVQNFIYASGSSVRAECSTGILDGVSQLFCDSGSWDAAFPACPANSIPMRMPCSSSSECLDTNSQCITGRCWCNPGLSHDPTNSACVDSCITYGTTFQEWDGYVIIGNDLRGSRKSLNTAADCLDYCASDSSCISADWNKDKQYCFFNTILPHQAGGDGFVTATHFFYFQRDCA